MPIKEIEGIYCECETLTVSHGQVVLTDLDGQRYFMGNNLCRLIDDFYNYQVAKHCEFKNALFRVTEVNSALSFWLSSNSSFSFKATFSFSRL